MSMILRKSLFLGLASMAITQAVFTLPSSPTVIEGDVSFSNPDQYTLVVSSNSARSIVEWDSFSADGLETIYFSLPDTESVILNRVTGTSSSDIGSSNYSNGSIFLVNENGITTGLSGVFLCFGFLGSTLDVSNMEFLAGNDMTFSGTSNQTLLHSGAVVTAGGDTTLLGYQIYNDGYITSTGETAALGSGQEIVFHPTGSERITVVSQGVQMSPTGIGIEFVPNGTINSRQLEMKADGGFFEYGIRHEGIINAIGVDSMTSGYVIFSAENGTTFLNGYLTNRNLDTTGGTVEVFGQTIILDNSCYLDTSGLIGGGQVNIGSRFQGSGAPYNSTNTELTSASYIVTDAGVYNDAGQVVVWSDDITNFYGTIAARGGYLSGNGGLVEVSGLNTLNFSGAVDNTAANGTDGMVLLDPNVLLYHPRRSK